MLKIEVEPKTLANSVENASLYIFLSRVILVYSLVTSKYNKYNKNIRFILPSQYFKPYFKHQCYNS